MMYRAWMMPGMSERWVLAAERGSMMWCIASVLTTKDGQEQVDEEVSAAATLKEDTERREQDGEDDLDDVAGVVC